MAHQVQGSIQRTLVLTLGESGEAVNQRVVQMLDEWHAPPVIAVRHLGGNRENAEVIDAALREISSLAHRTTLHMSGYRANRLDELVVWVVGPPSVPLGRTANLAANQAVELLDIQPVTLGLVVWDDHSILDVADPGPSGEPGPGQATLDDPTPRRTTRRIARAWSGCEHDAFTGPCYLVSQVNEAGMMLVEKPLLYEVVARFLVLHTCTSLRDAPTWIEEASGWGNGLGYASFGLSWLAWPAAVARDRAARDLAQSLIPVLLDGSHLSDEADARLREAALAPPSLIPRLTPRSVTEATRCATEVPQPPAPWTLLRRPDGFDHAVVIRLQTMVAERQAALAICAPAWEPLMQKAIRETTARARAWVVEALDRDGLGQARSLTGTLERRLGEWAAGAEQRREEIQEHLQRTERDIQAALESLTALLAEMPCRCLRDVLRLLRNPFRWARLWYRWREAQRLYTQLLTLQGMALAAKVSIEQMERACGVYWAVGSELQSISRELDRLERGLYDLLTPTSEIPEWPRIPLLLGDDPDALLARLVEQLLPARQIQAADFLAELGPLSRWWSDGLPDRSSVDEWVVDQVTPLVTIPVWDVVHSRHPQESHVQAWTEELVAQACPLWRWDPAELSDQERTCGGAATVMLSAPEDNAPWNDNWPGVRVLPMNSARALAVVTLRWGIPSLNRVPCSNGELSNTEVKR